MFQASKKRDDANVVYDEAEIERRSTVWPEIDFMKGWLTPSGVSAWD